MDDSLNDYLQICIMDYLKRSKEGQEEILHSLDNLGFRVGYSLIERLAPEAARFTDDISVMKYLCKDFWTTLFGKQIDNLKTNNSGTFVLHDNNFKPIAQISQDESATNVRQNFAAYTCGLLRGTLANFGYSNVVTSDLQAVPCCEWSLDLSVYLKTLTL